MKKIRLAELTDPVREFMRRLLEEDTVEIEDETGRTRGTFVPYRDPTPEEERKADETLQRIWAKTDKAMKEAGKTEEDLIREVLEDD